MPTVHGRTVASPTEGAGSREAPPPPPRRLRRASGRRRPRAGLLPWLLLAAALAGAAAYALWPRGGEDLPFGVAAGAVTPTSALLWTRLDAGERARLEVRGGGRTLEREVRASPEGIVRVRMRGLRPGTEYTYRFAVPDGASAEGRFRTAPPPNADVPVRFGVTADADVVRARRLGDPFTIYARLADEPNDFNAHIGDTIGTESGPGEARSLAAKRAKYRAHLEMPSLRDLRARAAMYATWDDHEFINDYARGVGEASQYAAGARAFRDYVPGDWSPRTGLYATARWGRNVELFVLDGRSFRSPQAYRSGACNNPQTGERDLGPAAPPALRRAMTPWFAPFVWPVSRRCLEALRDPRRTMLGAAQLAALRRDLLRSDATWKIVFTPSPIQQIHLAPYDRWEGYKAERAALLDLIRRRVPNVVFVAGDSHATLLTEVRDRPGRYRVVEAVTGPVASAPMGFSLERRLGRRGANAFLARFMKRPWPAGFGIRCAAIDGPSYLVVEATRRSLTLIPRDRGGNPVRERGGRACPPWRLPAQ